MSKLGAAEELMTHLRLAEDASLEKISLKCDPLGCCQVGTWGALSNTLTGEGQ